MKRPVECISLKLLNLKKNLQYTGNVYNMSNLNTLRNHFQSVIIHVCCILFCKSLLFVIPVLDVSVIRYNLLLFS
jgi:hypothetical protein